MVGNDLNALLIIKNELVVKENQDIYLSPGKAKILVEWIEQWEVQLKIKDEQHTKDILKAKDKRIAKLELELKSLEIELQDSLKLNDIKNADDNLELNSFETKNKDVLLENQNLKEELIGIEQINTDLMTKINIIEEEFQEVESKLEAELSESRRLIKEKTETIDDLMKVNVNLEIEVDRKNKLIDKMKKKGEKLLGRNQIAEQNKLSDALIIKNLENKIKMQSSIEQVKELPGFSKDKLNSLFADIFKKLVKNKEEAKLIEQVLEEHQMGEFVEKGSVMLEENELGELFVSTMNTFVGSAHKNSLLLNTDDNLNNNFLPESSQFDNLLYSKRSFLPPELTSRKNSASLEDDNDPLVDSNHKKSSSLRLKEKLEKQKLS